METATFPLKYVVLCLESNLTSACTHVCSITVSNPISHCRSDTFFRIE
jgi:hypothetical protein